MPYVRRAKRRTMRKRRKTINLTRKTYIRRSKANTLSTKRWVVKTVITGNDLIPSQGNGMLFTLLDVPNNTEFTALFDQYMLVGVQYRFTLRIDPDYVTTVANRGLYPYLKWVHDHDDANTPTASSQLEQYPKMQEFIFSSDRPNTRWYYLKPALANEVFGTIVGTAYSPKWRQWCDNNYPGIQHYGIKAWADQCFAGQSIYLECRYIMKFKGVV